MIIKMNKAVIIYYAEPLLMMSPQSTFRFDGNVEKYLKKLQKDILQDNLEWTVDLDSTEGNINELIKMGYTLMIFLPGLEKRLWNNNLAENAVFLKSLEFKSNDTTPVISLMKNLGN
ncbi:hypothetical protein SAMN02745116_00818 [Pilibacter termitis]|uniref:Uncharacterized protein n=1 Tax=Pilibacter termitis TaxID=263852 RepID=A0A1T4LV79_9ENTE|nr:hypothetical protein [Pilibacter termitis]SJZ58557.1 hypothetical protein SAMN02745116_00818 [Pilibacter termitis]